MTVEGPSPAAQPGRARETPGPPPGRPFPTLSFLHDPAVANRAIEKARQRHGSRVRSMRIVRVIDPDGNLRIIDFATEEAMNRPELAVEGPCGLPGDRLAGREGGVRDGRVVPGRLHRQGRGGGARPPAVVRTTSAAGRQDLAGEIGCSITTAGKPWRQRASPPVQTVAPCDGHGAGLDLQAGSRGRCPQTRLGAVLGQPCRSGWSG